MKKKLILFFLLYSTIAFSQNGGIESYVDEELKLPLSDYFSMPVIASFSDTIVNKFLEFDSLDYDVSSSPDFFNVYSTKPKKYGIHGKGHFIFERKIDLMGFVPLHSDFHCFILRTENLNAIKYDLWCMSKNYLVLGHLCLFYGNKEHINDDDVETKLVESEIFKDGTILWQHNNSGLIITREFILDSNGRLLQLSEKTDGEYEY